MDLKIKIEGGNRYEIAERMLDIAKEIFMDGRSEDYERMPNHGSRYGGLGNGYEWEFSGDQY